jgi:peptidoglycan/xylan/chitin deacetylase (PgdA/CDA1 family)
MLLAPLVIATATATAAAAASYAGYACMAPHSQLYGRTLTHGGDPGEMALTYDDGPNDPYTRRLLDVLARHNAKATFFLIGKYVRQRPDIVRAIQQAGHAIGNHTYTHPNLIFASRARLRQELEDCGKALNDALGEYQPLFRPPFGGRTPKVLNAARRMGLEPVMWSVTAYDWSARSADTILGHIQRQTGRTRPAQSEVVLLHDGGHLAFGTDRQPTIDATRQLLERYAPEGRRFVSIPELRRQPVHR